MHVLTFAVTNRLRLNGLRKSQRFIHSFQLIPHNFLVFHSSKLILVPRLQFMLQILESFRICAILKTNFMFEFDSEMEISN